MAVAFIARAPLPQETYLLYHASVMNCFSIPIQNLSGPLDVGLKIIRYSLRATLISGQGPTHVPNSRNNTLVHFLSAVVSM